MCTNSYMILYHFSLTISIAKIKPKKHLYDCTKTAFFFCAFCQYFLVFWQYVHAPHSQTRAYKACVFGNTAKDEYKERENTMFFSKNESAYVRTDLACERRRADTSLAGVSYTEEEKNGILKSTLRVESEEGERSIGKPKGLYITLSFKELWQQSEEELRSATEALSSVLLEMIRKDKKPSLLIAGLGNRFLTVDAIGPTVLARIVATAHLAELEPELFESLSCHKITAVTPGVLSQTGIESAALIMGAVKEASPDCVIVIDALAARDCSRLATTIQVSDTGILPGAGVGNPRTAIDHETLGIPVIVIGVPTVVDSSTLLYDALARAGMEEIPPTLTEVLENGRGYFVSPRECDAVTENVSRIIADAINKTFGIS